MHVYWSQKRGRRRPSSARIEHDVVRCCRTTRLRRIEIEAMLVQLLFIAVVTLASVTAFDAVFPTSIRQALAEKSKQLNPTSQYSAAGWSNRAATVLTPVHIEPAGVFTADRPFYWNKIDVGSRSTVIALPPLQTATIQNQPKADLFIHSPVALDGPMMQCINELGHVKHVCSPNYEHVKYAPVWHQNYKDACMWACPGLTERMPEVPWKGEIGNGYRPNGWKGRASSFKNPEGMWDTEILQPLHINVEKNPFTGRPFFNEVIFYHVPTKTLLTTDLFWNYPADGVPNSEFGRNDSWELAPLVDSVPVGSRLWKFGMDKVYYPFYSMLMVTDKSEYKAIANHILNVWDVETVIPAHGDILRGKDFIRSVLTRFFQLDES